MGQNRVRAVFGIERVDKKRVITNAILDGLGDLRKDLFCGIHKNFIEIFLVTDLIQHTRQRLYPHELILHEDDIVQTKEVFEVSKSDRCLHESVESTPDVPQNKKPFPGRTKQAKKKKKKNKIIPLQPQLPSPFMIRDEGCVRASDYITPALVYHEIANKHTHRERNTIHQSW